MKNKIKYASIVFCLSVLIMLVSFGEQKAEWKGKIEVKDGVKIVKNPKKPMYGEDVFNLEEELALGGADGREEYMFSRIRAVAVGKDERILILDNREAHVKVFDKDGHYLMTIGSPGQGPGELNRPRSISLNQKELMVHEAGRFSFFTLEGEFLRHQSSKEVWALASIMDSAGNIYVTEGFRDPDNPRYLLKKLDSQMNFISQIASSPAPNPSKSFNPFMPVGHWQIDKDDNLVYGYPKTYEIQIYNPEGKLIKKITKDYDPVEIPEEEKKEQIEDIPPQIKIKLDFPKHYSAFYRLCLDDEGRIFVRTWEKIGDEDVYYHDVFDSEGRCIAKVPIRIRAITCKKGKLYSLEEDEEGYPAVKRYKVTWKY